MRFKLLLTLFLVIVFSSEVFAGTVKKYVTIPSPCYKVDRIEGDKIYLISPDPESSCIQVAVKKEITIDESVKKMKVYIDENFMYEEEITGWDIDIIKDFNNRKEQFIKEMEKAPFFQNFRENVHLERGQLEAQNTYDIFRSSEFQSKIQKEVERLKVEVFSEQVKDFENYYSNDKKKKLAGRKNEHFYQTSKGITLNSDERLYIFISSSVPLETLRNYAKSLDRIGSPNARLVMRGFIGGMKYIKPTMQFISEILKKDPTCDFLSGEKCQVYNTTVHVDPILFRAYNIKEVPAIIYIKGAKSGDSSLSEGLYDNMTATRTAVIYGDVSVEYAIERLKNGGTE